MIRNPQIPRAGARGEPLMNFWKLFTILLGKHYTHTSGLASQKALFFPWKQPWAAPFYLHDSFERPSFFNWLMKLKATVSPWSTFLLNTAFWPLRFPKHGLLYQQCHWAWPLTCSSHVRDVSLDLKWGGWWKVQTRQSAPSPRSLMSSERRRVWLLSCEPSNAHLATSGHSWKVLVTHPTSGSSLL